MKGKNILLFGLGGSIGFIAGNVFVTVNAMKSKKLRQALSNIIADKISSLIFDDRHDKNRVSYKSFYKSTRRNPNYSSRIRYQCIFDNRGDAEKIFNIMRGIVRNYGLVSVADYYDLAGVKSISYVDNKYGWFNLDDVSVKRVEHGYIIDLPIETAIS